MKKLIILLSILCAANVCARQFTGSLKGPIPNNALAISVTHDNASQWGDWDTVHIKFTNNSSAVQNIANATVEFSSPTQLSSVLGNFPVFPDFQIFSAQNNKAYRNTIVLGKPQWSNGPINVATGQSFILTFNQNVQVNINNLKNSIKIYTETPITNYGNITITKPKARGTEILNYEKVAIADLYVQVQDKPNSNVPDNITIKLQDVSKKTAPSTEQVTWGQRNRINNLVAGDNYKLWTNSFSINNKQYIPDYRENTPYSFKTDAKNPAKVQIKYAEHMQPTDLNWPVKFNVSGLPDQNTKVEVTLTGTDNNTYKHNVHNGTGILFDKVKTGVYNIATEIYEKNGTIYRVILSNPYTINKNTTISVKVVKHR
jgi:hypothetical protein